MHNEVTDEDIEAAAAIDWSEVFKDSFMEPFDIKLPERPAEDVELLEGPLVCPKARQRPVTAKTKKFCAILSKQQKQTCKRSHHRTMIKEIYRDGSWHYGMEVCAECDRYIKFVPWPQHLWHLRDKIRGSWSNRASQQMPLSPEPLCEHCGKNARHPGSTWCDACMWSLIKDDQES
jgi:hypothetical protein